MMWETNKPYKHPKHVDHVQMSNSVGITQWNSCRSTCCRMRPIVKISLVLCKQCTHLYTSYIHLYSQSTSTSLEWQIHVTQGSKDKLRGSQTTNIHQPVTNQPRKLKIGRLVHHFHTVCSLGWCCNLFQTQKTAPFPPVCSTKATVWSKACRAVADGAESKRWKNLPVSSVCRVQSAESPTVPHQWGCMIILYYCKVISSNKNHTHNIWKIVSHTRTHTYIYI